jgi:cohesin complex subunit SA-1/2
MLYLLFSGSTVLSVSQYKANFDSLLKHLSDIFLHSSDEVVLHKIAKSLSHLRQSQYSHAADVDAFICKMVDELYDRILPFLSNQSSRNSAQEKESQSSSEPLNRSARRSSRNSKQDKERMPPLTPTQSQADLECSFSVNLLRFRILSQQVDISFCFDHSRIKDVNSIEEFSNMLCDSLIRRLNERSLGDDQHVHDRSAWGNCSEECHAYATIVIDEGLHVLMTILAWNVLSVMKNMGLVLENEIDDVDSIRRDDLSGEDVTDHFTLRLRNRLISLVVMCFDHFSSGDDEDSVSKCQIHWSHSVQESAGLIASDLRMLFPKEWSEAASPLLRSLSITDDAHLIAGYVRYLRSKQDEMVSEKQNFGFKFFITSPLTLFS